MTASIGSDLPHHTTVIASIGLTHIHQVAEMKMSQVDALIGGSTREFASLVIALKDHGLWFTPETNPTQVLGFSDPITLLELPLRALNGLARGGIVTINDLLNSHPLQLLNIKSFGVQCLKDAYLGLARIQVKECSNPTSRIDLFGKLPEWATDQSALSAADSLEQELSLAERVESLSSTLKPIEREVLADRSRVDGSLTLQEIAEKHDLSRERIRQIEVLIAKHFADDSEVQSAVTLLGSCAPLVELEAFISRGFAIDDFSGIIHFLAQKSHLLPSRSSISVIELHNREFVHIGNSESLVTTAELKTIDKMMLDRPDLRQGDITDLNDEILNYLRNENSLGRNLSDDAIDSIRTGMLVNTSFWRSSEKYIWTDGAKYETLRSRILLEGQPLTLKQLEHFYDEVFPGDEKNQRRVTAFLFNKSYDFVRTSEDYWSHKDLGAVALGTIVNRMRTKLESNDGSMQLSHLIVELQAVDPSVKASTVTTYANAGIIFDIEDGVIFLRASSHVSKPEHTRRMFRVLDTQHRGCWSWQCVRDDGLLYKSSLRIPDALYSLLASIPSSTDDTVDFGELGEARVGSSGTSHYFTTRLGFRDVLDAAKIANGTRFRLIVIDKGKAVVEPMTDIDTSNDISYLSSVIGLVDNSLNLTDACLMAVGLEPTLQNSATEITRRVTSRGSDFAEAFFALNPWLRTKS